MSNAFGLILAAPLGTTDIARPIAGAPLLVRQLEWLKAQGVRRVAVNRVADAPPPVSLRREILDATGVEVVWIPSAEPLDRVELARRAGSTDALLVVLPHGCVGAAPLADAVNAANETHDDVRLVDGGVAVDVVHAEGRGRATRTIEGAWMRLVRSEPTCQALNEDILMGALTGVEVRGTRLRDGVWTSRGAVVVEGARLEAPCFLGRDSFVAEGASVGPGAILGDGAVVESGASVQHARVGDRVVVGRGIAIARALADGGIVAPHRGGQISLDDPLLLGSASVPSLGPRVGAAVALAVVVGPALVAGGAAKRVARALSRVIEGDATWIGVAGEDDTGVVLDVEPQLVPPDASDEAREAARALYRAKKSLRFDVTLLAGLVARRLKAVTA